ncbi:MAG: hypothetical protein ACP5LJ_06160 [Candidatus Bipolaricaulaceae bacterium]
MFIAGLAGLFCSVFLIFPDFLRDFFVDPAMRLFLILDAFPQAILWLLFVGLFAFFAFRFLSPWPKEEAKVQKRRPRPSTAQELALLLQRARYSPWARRALRHRLARIFVNLRVEKERIAPEEAWQDLWDGTYPGDCALGRFLRGDGHQDFEISLKEALRDLQRYAQGGEIDG